MVTTTRTVNVANANADRYLYELRSAYSGLRIWDPDFALQRDPWIYEKMLRDPTIRQCLGERLRGVAGGGWSITTRRNPTPADEKAARIMEMLIDEISKGFVAARVNLAKFVWEGTRHAYVRGRREWRDFGDGIMREWWVPLSLEDINKRRVRVWREGGRVVRKLEQIMNEDGVVSYEPMPFPIDRVITAVYEDEEGRLGFGRGLGDSCYWPFWGKWKIMDVGVEAALKWAEGVPVVKTDVTQLGDTTQTSVAVRNALAESVRDMKRGGVIAIGTGDEVEWHHGQGTDPATMMALLQKMDDMIRMLLTGAKLPSGGGNDETGSLARAEVEQDTSEGIAQIDSAVLDDAITHGLIGSVWRRNRENLIDMGLGMARMPVFVSRDEKREDHAMNAKLITDLLSAGIKLKKSEVYEKVGLTEPTEEDEAKGDVLEGGAGGGGGSPFDGLGFPGGDDPGVDEPEAPETAEPEKATPYRFDRGGFDESKHERDADGKFAPKGQGGEGGGDGEGDGESGGDAAAADAPNVREMIPAESDDLVKSAEKKWGRDWFDKIENTLNNPEDASVDDLLETWEHFRKISIRAISAGNQDLHDKSRAFSDKLLGELERRNSPSKPDEYVPPPEPKKSKPDRATADKSKPHRRPREKLTSKEQVEIGRLKKVPDAAGYAREKLKTRLHVDPNVPIETVRTVIGAATLAKKARVPMPDRVRIGFLATGRRVGRKTAAAFTPAFPDSLFINPDSDAWKRGHEYLKQDARRLHEMGWMSTDHPAHTFVHEMGHYQHFKKSPKEVLSTIDSLHDRRAAAAERAIMGEVSRATRVGDRLSDYGYTNRVEFVAECYARKKLGKSLTDRQQHYYDQFGGP